MLKLFPFLIMALTLACSEPADDDIRGAVTETQPSSTVAASSATRQATTTLATSTTTQPTSTPSARASYVVKSGDTLGAICSAQVPSMSIPDCVEQIVSINKMAGPDQLSLGQSLALPGPGTTQSNAVAGSPSPTSAPSVPNSTSTPSSAPTLAPTVQLAVPTSVPTGGGSGGRFTPSGSDCPATHPIKGNDSSSGEFIYHRPGQQAYDRTEPEACFATEADAQIAGYRAAQR